MNKKKEDDLFRSIPPSENFNAFPNLDSFPDEIISALTSPKNKEKKRQMTVSNDNDRMSLSLDKDISHEQMTVSNDNDTSYILWKIKKPSIPKTRNQKLLFKYLLTTGNIITTIGAISKDTGISPRTIHRILTLFEKVGYISKEKYIKGEIRGIKITLSKKMMKKAI